MNYVHAAHMACLARVELVVSPIKHRGVRTVVDCPAKSIVLVPVTMSVAMRKPLEEVAATAVRLREGYFCPMTAVHRVAVLMGSGGLRLPQEHEPQSGLNVLKTHASPFVCVYWMVKPSDDPSLVNLTSVDMQADNGVKIPCLTNVNPIEKGTVLMFKAPDKGAAKSAAPTAAKAHAPKATDMAKAKGTPKAAKARAPNALAAKAPPSKSPGGAPAPKSSDGAHAPKRARKQ
jgi:hypothetical protein